MIPLLDHSFFNVWFNGFKSCYEPWECRSFTLVTKPINFLFHNGF